MHTKSPSYARHVIHASEDSTILNDIQSCTQERGHMFVESVEDDSLEETPWLDMLAVKEVVLGGEVAWAA